MAGEEWDAPVPEGVDEMGSQFANCLDTLEEAFVARGKLAPALEQSNQEAFNKAMVAALAIFTAALDRIRTLEGR
jgi:hypothetical protein